MRPGMKIIYKHYLQNTQKIYTSRLGDDEKGSVVSKWECEGTHLHTFSSENSNVQMNAMSEQRMK